MLQDLRQAGFCFWIFWFYRNDDISDYIFSLSSLLGSISTVLLSYPWGGVLTASELTACGIILFFTCINMISIRFSGNLQVILTVIPVTLVLAFCLYGVFCYDTQAPKEALTKVDTNYFDILRLIS